MKVNDKFKVKVLQEGGTMPDQQTQPAQATPESGEDIMAQIVQVAVQGVQNNDCEAMKAVCMALIQLAQGGAGGQEQATAEPTLQRKGGKLTIKRKK